MKFQIVTPLVHTSLFELQLTDNILRIISGLIFAVSSMGSFEYDSSDIPDSVRSYLRGFQKAVDQQNVDEILQVLIS